MTITTLSSREFNQAASQAKKAAEAGPVFITDRGEPAHVLLSMADYKRLTAQSRNIADLLAVPAASTIELEITRQSELARAADFS